MVSMPLPRRLLCFLPCTAFLYHWTSFYSYQWRDKSKIGQPFRAICPGDKDHLVKNTSGSMDHRLTFVLRAKRSYRSLSAYKPNAMARKDGVAHSLASRQ
jgi:hypothetical protein